MNYHNLNTFPIFNILFLTNRERKLRSLYCHLKKNYQCFGFTMFGRSLLIPDHCYMYVPYHIQGRIQDLVLGGTKFGKVIWEYNYYCLGCLWNVWCRKIKIDLQVIMIIWGDETEPFFFLSVFSFFSISFLGCFYLCFLGGGGERPFRPLWIRQWHCICIWWP